MTLLSRFAVILVAMIAAVSCASSPAGSPAIPSEPQPSPTASAPGTPSTSTSPTALPAQSPTMTWATPSPAVEMTPVGTPESTATPMPVPTGYSVHIADGLNPRWNAQDAAAKVMGWIAINERVDGRVVAPAQILSVEAMRGRDVPRAISGPYRDLPIAWVVHASGTFVNEHGPSVYSHWFFTEAWHVFDDNGEGQGEALTNPVGQVVTPPPVTPHPSGACPLLLKIVNDYYIDVDAMINDDLGVTVEAGKTYLVNEWTTTELVPPPPPWHVVLTYRPSNDQFFETTVFPPGDEQLTITRTGVAQSPYNSNGC
jgi:hypothetical protein